MNTANSVLHIISIPFITTQLLQFEPTNVSNFIKGSVLQHASSCMFRASQVHYQGAHDCRKQYFSTVEPRTQAAPITMSDNPEKRNSVLARIAIFIAHLDLLYKCYTFQKVLTFIFTVLKQNGS